MSELWCGPGYRERWNPLFNKFINDWEVERLISLIGKVIVVDVMEDRLIWKENRKVFLLVKSMYKALRPRCPKSFPWEIWFGSLVCSQRFSFLHGRPYREKY